MVTQAVYFRKIEKIYFLSFASRTVFIVNLNSDTSNWIMFVRESIFVSRYSDDIYNGLNFTIIIIRILQQFYRAVS